MDITQFVEGSIGQWRSQRSAHHMVFAHFEAVRSEIDIVALTPDNLAVIEHCQSYDIDPITAGLSGVSATISISERTASKWANTI